MIRPTLFIPTNSKNHHYLFTYIPQTGDLYLWYAQPFSHQTIMKIYIYHIYTANRKSIFMIYPALFIPTNSKNHHYLFTYIPQTENLYLWYAQPFSHQPITKIYIYHIIIIPQTENLYLWYAQSFSHRPIMKIYIYHMYPPNGKSIFVICPILFTPTDNKNIHISHISPKLKIYTYDMPNPFHTKQ